MDFDEGSNDIAERLLVAVSQRNQLETRKALAEIFAAAIERNQKDLRQRVGGLFLVADEGEREGEQWWVVYFAGVRCFASVDENKADDFRRKLHADVIDRLGLK